MNNEAMTFELFKWDSDSGKQQTRQVWKDWAGFYQYAKKNLAQLDNAFLRVCRGEQAVVHYAPQALFASWLLSRPDVPFTGQELLRNSSTGELPQDITYAQSYGRWLCVWHMHDFTVPTKQMNWLVENGAAVYLWPISQLSVENLSTDGVDLDQVAARLDDLDHKLCMERGAGLDGKELTAILKHSVQHLLAGQSLSECRDYIPDRFQSRFAVWDRNAYQLMLDYVSERYQRTSYDTLDSDGNTIKEEFYLGDGLPSPMEDYPLKLSAEQWHQLCSLHTELIQNGEVPDEILNDRAFWFPVQDLVKKGGYLMGDERYGENFDEQEVFARMPDEIRNTLEVAVTLLKLRVCPDSFFNKKLVHQAYLQFEPQYYRRIPRAYRERPEFAPAAERAVQWSPYSVNVVPDKQLTPAMLHQAIEQDFSLLLRFPESFLKQVPGIEDTLVRALQDFDKQSFLEGLEGYVDPLSQRLAIDDAKAHALKCVPESLRTARVCQEALRLHADNSRYVPVGIQLTAERSRPLSQGRRGR